MPFPEHLVNYGGADSRNRSRAANQLEKYGPDLAHEMNLLAGLSGCDRPAAHYIYGTDRMPPECPLEDILAISAWRMITDSILHEIENNLLPDFSKAAALPVSARLEIDASLKFPRITPDMDLEDFDAGFRKAAEMPLGRYSLPIACYWLQSALCHNGIHPFLVKGDMRDFLQKTGGQLPGTALRLLEADRFEPESKARPSFRPAFA